MNIIILLLNLFIMENKIATFGSGCFWCIEAVFELVDGVVSVESGYSAGNTVNPTYKEVTTGKTNHAEVVNIEYNPSQISYPELLEIFWRTHDPTTLNRQGADVGTQYRSIILYHDTEQKEFAENILSELENNGLSDQLPNATQVVSDIQSRRALYIAVLLHDIAKRRRPRAQ